MVGKIAVAGQAVQAVQLQVFFEPLRSKKAAERALPHLADVHEAKMILDQADHLLDPGSRELEPPADFLGHSGPPFGVSVEPDPFPDGEGIGLAHVVKQHCQGQGRAQVPSQGEHETRVLKDVPFRMERRRLHHAVHGEHLRQHLLQHARVG